MYPILIQIPLFSIFGYEFGPWLIFSYGVIASIGFIIAVYWFLKLAQRHHIHLEFFVDHFLSLALWTFIGARLSYIFIFYARYRQDPLSILSFWDGGYLLWGGFVFFLLAFSFHAYRQKEKIGQWLDVIIPAGVVAFLFENLAAFMAGKGYGKPTELPWGISFENPEVPYTIPIHPVQLYSFVLLIGLLFIISLLHKQRVRESLIGLVSLSLFAAISFFVEYFRGDEMLIYFGHRFTQILQLAVFAFAVALIFFNTQRNR